MRDSVENWKGGLQGKKGAVAIAIVVAILAVAAPILISLELARRQSLAEQTNLAEQIATEALQRAEQTDQEFAASIRTLQRRGDKDPCSDNNITRMARVAIAADQLQALGYVTGNHLLCSSFGRYDPAVDIGQPDFENVRNGVFRTAVALPDVPGVKFILITEANSGYTAIIHPDLVLDVFAHDPAINIGIFSISAKKPIDSRGAFDPRWLAALGNRRSVELTTGDNVVAIRRSDIGDFGAFAVIPAVSGMYSLRKFAVVLVPLGALAGIALALAVLYVARLQLALPAVLRTALRRDEFFIEYQPIMDLETGRWRGAEALIRWRRANGERVRPEIFIPVAEETGLITRITERALDLVARDAMGLFESHPTFHLSVNLSAADLSSAGILKHLNRLALATKAGAGQLTVEVTEHGLVKGELAKKLLHDIRAAGFNVAIDDFGTGYSSLSYLQTLEADFLKIDRAFVETIGTDSATSHVVSHIIEMARSLKLELIAEGVETEAQVQFLRQRGVRYMQGWFFAKPMPFGELLSGIGIRSA